MATPSEILTKKKAPEGKKTDKKDNDADDKKGGNKRNALVDFIAKYKKG